MHILFARYTGTILLPLLYKIYEVLNRSKYSPKTAKLASLNAMFATPGSSTQNLVFSDPIDLECKDLQTYLGTRSPQTLEKLYNFPAICLVVYRELPEIARHFVIRILFVEQPVPQAVVSSWGSQYYAKEHQESTNLLTVLNIWHVTAIPGGLSAWELSCSFKKNLKMVLLGGGKPWSITHIFDKDSKPRDIVFLDTYAMSRWRCVLHYMVGPSSSISSSNFSGGRSNGSSNGQYMQENEGISPDAVRILLHANMMKRDETGRLRITTQGFQFLLMDTQSQVWHFMLQYLDTCEEHGLSLPECLSMLFQLSLTTLGRDYSSEGLPSKMLTFLQHLRELGLVFQRKRKEGRFYPTRLALNITNRYSTASAFDEKQRQQDAGYIIVETNYRVYAYTDSPLKMAILGLFTELIYRFPNFIVGILSRDSVRQALRGGITAEQIVSYLKQYAHPIIKNTEKSNSGYQTTSPLPLEVADQIKLWELERNRFTYTEGVVYNQFLSLTDFVTLRDYAQTNGWLVWQNERGRTMVVSKHGHDDVKKYWKRYSKSGG